MGSSLSRLSYAVGVVSKRLSFLSKEDQVLFTSISKYSLEDSVVPLSTCCASSSTTFISNVQVKKFYYFLFSLLWHGPASSQFQKTKQFLLVSRSYFSKALVFFLETFKARRLNFAIARNESWWLQPSTSKPTFIL